MIIETEKTLDTWDIVAGDRQTRKRKINHQRLNFDFEASLRKGFKQPLAVNAADFLGDFPPASRRFFREGIRTPTPKRERSQCVKALKFCFAQEYVYKSFSAIEYPNLSQLQM